MHPSDFFEDAPAVKGGQCFVVMPFARKFDEVYTAIKSALEVEELGIICHRADKVVRGGEVMKDVLHDLAEAELVIVDLTGKNANVFYELGIAHTVRCAESVLLITQTMKHVPFDVQHYRCIKYTLGDDGLMELRNKLAQMVKTEILPTRFVFRLAAGQVGDSYDKIPGEDRRFLYSFKICDVMLARDSAQFRLDVYQHQGNLPAERVYSEFHGLQREERMPVPRTLYALKLDAASPDEAAFCICRPNPSAA